MADWIKNKQLIVREHIVEGLENAPRAFCGLFRGENFGRGLVHLADPSYQNDLRKPDIGQAIFSPNKSSSGFFLYQFPLIGIFDFQDQFIDVTGFHEVIKGPQTHPFNPRFH